MNIKQITVAALAATTTATLTAAVPEVSDATMAQAMDRLVTITYTLADAPAVVTLDVQTNYTENGATKWASIGGAAVANAQGDVWKQVSTGSRTITWRPDLSWPDHKIADGGARAVVTAWALDNTPDYMVVDISAAAQPNTQKYYPSVDYLPGGILGNDDYRTTSIVMRKIMAKDVEWTMGSTTLETNNRKPRETTHKVMLTNTELLEGMSSISALIKAMERNSATNNRKILKILVDENKKKSKAREIGFLKAKSSQLGFSIEFVGADLIAERTVGQTHGGIIAECTSRDIPSLNGADLNKNGIYYFLEGVEDPYNFGYAVRSLYASGADGLILSPRNWMGAAGIVARSSAGASELIDLYISEPTEAIDIFKKLGYTVICAGIRDSVSIFDSDLKKPLFVILGGEKRGISGAVLDMADNIVRIDYGTEFGGSLSTAAAAAVFGFEILRQNRES